MGSFISRLRILPVTIAALCLLLSAKLFDIYETGNEYSQMILGKPAYAEEEQAADEQTVEQAANDVASPEETNVASLPAETEQGVESSSDIVKEGDKREFSDIELDILQSLSERREELDALEKEIRMKGNVLEATEMRLEQKIEQIKALENTVKELLKEYDEKEDAKIRSLVKIYENMKPKDAARIFNELEMPILLLVVDRMSERKAAPILATMTPLKAKELTVELAEQRKMRNQQKAMVGVQ